MNEEEIIRKRLLVDGDGTGDERRINLLLKKFMKWSNRDDNGPEVLQVADSLHSQIAQCEYAFLKSRLTASMTNDEMKIYGDVQSDIENNIVKIKDEIRATKDDLKEAKVIRKNRLECEVLVKVISEQPDRKETNYQLSNLQAEISSLEDRDELLLKKLDMRRKQFHVVYSALNQLQSFLDDEASDSLSTEDVSMEELDVTKDA